MEAEEQMKRVLGQESLSAVTNVAEVKQDEDWVCPLDSVAGKSE